VAKKRKLTLAQRHEELKNECLDKFVTDNGCFRHFDSLAFESEQLLDIVISEQCSDLPRLAQHKEGDFHLYKEAENSGKLDPHVNVLKSKDAMYLLHRARLLVTFAMQLGHEELLGHAKQLLSSVYTELSPLRDTGFGETMMARDVKLFEELKARHDMIEGMSHAAKHGPKHGKEPRAR
jgi:hypothetical protein